MVYGENKKSILLDNITDEEYAASVNKNGNRYTPGASRSGLLSLAYKF